jgi:hypothetical protein
MARWSDGFFLLMIEADVHNSDSSPVRLGTGEVSRDV